MSLTIQLPPEVESQFRAEAQRRGLSLDQFVAEWLASHAPPSHKPLLNHAEAERQLDELMESFPEMPALSDEMLRRENIYDEDLR